MITTVPEVTEQDFAGTDSHIQLLNMTMGDAGLLELAKSYKSEPDEQIKAENFHDFAAFWAFLRITLVTGWDGPADPNTEEYQSAVRLFRRLRDALAGNSAFITKRVQDGTIVGPVGSAVTRADLK